MTRAPKAHFCEPDKHQADRSESHDHDGVTRLNITFMQTAQNTSERLDEGSIFVRELVRYGVRVRSNDALRQAHELRIGPVIEQEIFAEILLIVPTEETSIARGGVRRDDALPHAKLRDTLPNGDNIASHSWPKSAGGMIILA